MALIAPERKGLSRTWELASAAISSATASDTAECGLNTFNGTLYLTTSGAVLMTVQVQESIDNENWHTTTEEEITGNKAFRITHPFMYMRVNVSSYSSGQIDGIKLIGLVQ